MKTPTLREQEAECLAVAAGIMQRTKTNQGSPREKIRFAVAVAYRIGRQRPVWPSESKPETLENSGETPIDRDANQP